MLAHAPVDPVTIGWRGGTLLAGKLERGSNQQGDSSCPWSPKGHLCACSSMVPGEEEAALRPLLLPSVSGTETQPLLSPSGTELLPMMLPFGTEQWPLLPHSGAKSRLPLPLGTVDNTLEDATASVGETRGGEPSHRRRRERWLQSSSVPLHRHTMKSTFPQITGQDRRRRRCHTVPLDPAGWGAWPTALR